MRSRWIQYLAAGLAAVVVAVGGPWSPVHPGQARGQSASAEEAAGPGPATPPAAVLEAQRERTAAIERASAATVAVYDSKGEGGGSGVLISADGFALTNFHVVATGGPAFKCGLNDHKLYDAVVVGIDPVGDVALIQLLGRDDFPVAEIGDSDLVQTGDWV
ncbi:MAG TPA: trypsin-like peptidase domain-containing protein, partial [Lacipirellulaceae bacterium]|nr:trypsin-like peptidase domain-containing protein [Lacipirellulaceae bacterium]